MKTEKQKLIDKLKAGGSSSEKAKKDAENIIALAGQYNNEIQLDRPSQPKTQSPKQPPKQPKK